MPRFALFYLCACVMLVIGILISLSIGARLDIGLLDLLSFPFAESPSLKQDVMFNVRLPRSLLAFFVGANLALAGVILQAITQNPLASPSILGINQGATLAVSLGILLPFLAPINSQLLAILGAIVAGSLTFLLAYDQKSGFKSIRLVLAGIAIGAFSYAFVRFIFILDDDLSRQIIDWTSGDLSSANWSKVSLIFYVSIFAFILAQAFSHSLNILALGENSAKNVGLNPQHMQLIGALLAAIVSAITVSVAGPIMFVGLVIPHLMRHLLGHDHRILIIANILAGGLLMTLADILAKIINFPYETPTGIICALIGAPFFLYQAFKYRG